MRAVPRRERQKRACQLRHGNAEYRAVDGLDAQRWAVDIHQLHQTPAGGMALPRGGGGRLYFLPVRLGRGKGMVPVAHGDGQRRPAGPRPGILRRRRLCAQRRYGVFHSRNVRSVRYRPACNVPAAQHQLRVVQFFQRRLFFRERLHHAAGSVIQQQS